MSDSVSVRLSELRARVKSLREELDNPQKEINVRSLAQSISLSLGFLDEELEEIEEGFEKIRRILGEKKK